MDFIREITYEVWARIHADYEEKIGVHKIYTLLDVPEAQKALENRYVSNTVRILQFRALPYLKDSSH